MRIESLSARLIGCLMLMGYGILSSAAEDACDRACLNGFVDQYLAALVIHDPSGLPLAKGVKYGLT
jgi:hypothetical protein